MSIEFTNVSPGLRDSLINGAEYLQAESCDGLASAEGNIPCGAQVVPPMLPPAEVSSNVPADLSDWRTRRHTRVGCCGPRARLYVKMAAKVKL